MSEHHEPNCAFAISFGDLECDCTGPALAEPPADSDVPRLTPFVRSHLEAARAALRGPKGGA